MDIIELRVLAVAGMLTVGIVVSGLAVSAVAVAGWIGRVSRARGAGLSGQQAVRQRSDLDAERARC